MTITLWDPLSGRIGPGISVSAGWDLVGPHVANTLLVASLLETSSSDLIMSSTAQLPTNTGLVRLGDLFRKTGGMFKAVSDGTSLTLRLEVYEPGSGTVDTTDTTGFTWDPTSGVWYLITASLVQAVNELSGESSPKLDDILAAVRHVYAL